LGQHFNSGVGVGGGGADNEEELSRVMDVVL